MKKIINIVIFGLLLLIFGSFMFTFQVVPQFNYYIFFL